MAIKTEPQQHREPSSRKMLMAAGLSGVSALSIIGHLYYPFALGLMAFASILFRFPRKYS